MKRELINTSYKFEYNFWEFKILLLLKNFFELRNIVLIFSIIAGFVCVAHKQANPFPDFFYSGPSDCRYSQSSPAGDLCPFELSLTNHLPGIELQSSKRPAIKEKTRSSTTFFEFDEIPANSLLVKKIPPFLKWSKSNPYPQKDILAYLRILLI